MKAARVLGALLMGLMVLAVGPASQALAAPPDIIPLHIDRTVEAAIMTDYCGFTVLRHDLVDGRLIVRHTQSGNEVDLNVERGTATFSANGHSIDGRFSGFDRETYYSDGSFSYLSVGTGFYIVLPRNGPVWGETGSTTFTLDPDGNVISERDFQHDVFESSPAVCTALQP